MTLNMKKENLPNVMNIQQVFEVSEMRFELTQPFGHYPLKVARLPIPPPGQMAA